VKSTANPKKTNTKKAPKEEKNKGEERIFTTEEIKEYDGSDPNKPIYVVVLGQVFDVTKGKSHYQKGTGYNVFAGQDASSAFVTGDFSSGKPKDSIDGLTPQQVADIWHWVDFYGKHNQYFYVGKLIGRYYNEKGEPTAEYDKVQEQLKEAKKLKAAEEAENIKFPGCNSRWAEGVGGEVWCADMSGGIKRDWVGVPRKFFYSWTRELSLCMC